MYEEIIEYRDRCKKYSETAPTPENSLYWKERFEECETLLKLYREKKMHWGDWERMKAMADLNRMDRDVESD